MIFKAYPPDVIPRTAEKAVLDGLARNPAVALLGPRQCGKTTLARKIADDRAAGFFDLEDPADRARLEIPGLALEKLVGLVVIDEVQRMPAIFETLRVLIDRPGNGARFLLLGSASPHIVRGVSESLAGRVHHVDLGGFDLSEVGPERIDDLWLRGGFPRAFLADVEGASAAWRSDFIRTFLERDLPQLGITIPSATLGRFWTMVAHYHGQIWNAAELARSLGSSEPTARRYLDLMTGAYVVRQLHPWFENVAKRQVRAPKVYVRDSGLLHALLGLASHTDLGGHPKVGASWEGFVIEQILTLTRQRDAYFWATHGGGELDLLVFDGPRRRGYEVKRTDAPKLTSSMRSAMESLRLDSLEVVHAGRKSYPLAEGVRALAAKDLVEELLPRVDG